MRLDVWSDVLCPWCYVGKRNLEAALSELGDEVEVEVRWRAFELDPNAPASSSLSMAEVLSRKYGVSIDEARAMNAKMTKLAASVGLDYRLDEIKPANSFDAHRLAKLAEDHGLGAEAAERLFAAYFTEAELMSDHDTLIRLGVEIGLSADEVAAMLASDAYVDDVRGDEAIAAEAGFSGVPTYVIDGRFAIPGAQPPETLLRFLRKLASGSLDDLSTSSS